MDGWVVESLSRRVDESLSRWSSRRADESMNSNSFCGENEHLLAVFQQHAQSQLATYQMIPLREVGRPRPLSMKRYIWRDT